MTSKYVFPILRLSLLLLTRNLDKTVGNSSTFLRKRLSGCCVMKRSFQRSAMLDLPKRERQYTLGTDASDEHIACVLPQEHDERCDHPLRYWPLALYYKQKMMTKMHRKGLSFVCAVTPFQSYVEEICFTIRKNQVMHLDVLTLVEAIRKLVQ